MVWQVSGKSYTDRNAEKLHYGASVAYTQHTVRRVTSLLSKLLRKTVDRSLTVFRKWNYASRPSRVMTLMHQAHVETASCLGWTVAAHLLFRIGPSFHHIHIAACYSA